MLVRIFIAVAVIIGVVLALKRTGLGARIIVYAAIFFVSVVLMSGPYFTDDPKTWLHTYVTGLFQLGVVSLAIHVVPCVIGYYATKFVRRNKQ